MKRLLLLLISCTLWSCDRSAEPGMFTSLGSTRTGVNFKNTLRETEAFNVLNYGYFYNGGGVAVGDINNDGLPDIYMTANLKASRVLHSGEPDF